MQDLSLPLISTSNRYKADIWTRISLLFGNKPQRIVLAAGSVEAGNMDVDEDAREYEREELKRIVDSSQVPLSLYS